MRLPSRTTTKASRKSHFTISSPHHPSTINYLPIICLLIRRASRSPNPAPRQTTSSRSSRNLSDATMKSTPLIINWHDQNAPIYSAHFEPHGKGRLATAAGDNNVRVRRYFSKSSTWSFVASHHPPNTLLTTQAALEDRGRSGGQESRILVDLVKAYTGRQCRSMGPQR